MNSRRLMVPQVECLNPSTGVVVGKIDAVKAAKVIGDIPQNVNFAVSLGTLQFFPEAGTGLPEGAMALGLVSSYSRTSPKADNQRRAQCAISGSARVYSITSSAWASSVGDTSRPRDFAVLRLITSSKGRRRGPLENPTGYRSSGPFLIFGWLHGCLLAAAQDERVLARVREPAGVSGGGDPDCLSLRHWKGLSLHYASLLFDRCD